MDKNREDNLSGYIIRNSRRNERNLKYDFMPELLEIIDKPSHVACKVIILGITALLIVAIIWAAIAELDVIVSGSGHIVTEEEPGAVISKASGVVKIVNAAEGSIVKSGDILLELDSSELEMDIAHTEESLKLLNVQRDVLSMYAADVNAKVDATMYDKEYRNIINALIYENELYKLQSKETLYNSEMLLAQYRQSVNEKLIKVEESIRTYTNQLEKERLELSNMTIRAPRDGYVLSSNVSFEGQVVSVMQELFVIIPYESSYVFEGYVKDKDIAKISIGDEVQLKLSAYSFSDYGAVTGKVCYISPSVVSKEGIGNVYEVRVCIDNENMHKEIELISGMSGTMEVKVGKRSVMDYFLEPIVGALDDSLKE